MDVLCSECNTPIACKPEVGCWRADLPIELSVRKDGTITSSLPDVLAQVNETLKASHTAIAKRD